MKIKKMFFVCFLFAYANHLVATASLVEQFQRVGYVEFCDQRNTAATYDMLYQSFDELVEFLNTHPAWSNKLYNAKERFVRSKDKQYYSTDFFGLYDESSLKGRAQIAFYYSVHFHDFISVQYPEMNAMPEIGTFLKACREIQESYTDFFEHVAIELGLENLFSSSYGRPPILFKVMKYLPSYVATRPHYDGSAFSLFLDSTDYDSLLLSPYRSALTIHDFITPTRHFVRWYDQNSIVLIPGTFLKEFAIDPTPHIVVSSGKTRYATIAFAMRPGYVQQRNEFGALPSFKY